MKKFKILAFVVSVSFIACDKIDDPIPKDLGTSVQSGDGVEVIADPSLGLLDTASIRNFIQNNVWTNLEGADNSETKFILLEEFTGHKCTSCPNGTREISRLKKDIFGDTLIPVGIHTGSFAVPDKSGNPQYSTDFRVGGDDDVAEAYVMAFQVAGNPRGIVNRVGVAEAETQWEASIRARLAESGPAAKLALTTHYDSINNIIRAQADIEWNTSLDSLDKYNLQFYVIEGKIFDWQLDNGVIKFDYEHKFVLRKIVNGTFGKELKAPISGDIEKIQYIFNADSKWKAKNVEVIAFIFKNDPNAYEVIQANSAYIK